MRFFRTIVLLICCLLSISVLAAQNLPTFALTPAIRPINHSIYALHITIFWICVTISVAVFGVMLYLLIKRWKCQQNRSDNFHSSLKIEVLWAVIPFLILVIMAVPTTLVMMHMKDVIKADVNIKVVKLHGKWQYQYLGEGLNFSSDLPGRHTLHAKPSQWQRLAGNHPLVVPVHQRIHFIFDAKERVPTALMPALQTQRELMPGFIHEAWARIQQPGQYQAKCQDLCGINHGFLPIVLIAKPRKDYRLWLTNMKRQVAKSAG
jgi:cytochrome c oxidase subunit II